MDRKCKEYHALYYQRNKERIKQKMRDFSRANPEKVCERKARYAQAKKLKEFRELIGGGNLTSGGGP